MVDQITNPQLDFDILLKMAFFRAALYGAAGRLDEAFDCLDQAIAYRDPALVHLAVAPDWDSLRADPRFAERLRSMALPSVAYDNIGKRAADAASYPQAYGDVVVRESL
jgi:hypothetical protein